MWWVRVLRRVPTSLTASARGIKVPAVRSTACVAAHATGHRARGTLLVQFAVFGPLLALYPALNMGGQLARGNPPTGDLGAVLTAVSIVGLYLGVASALQQSRIGSVGPLVRTSVPPTVVSVGRFAGELLQATALFSERGRSTKNIDERTGMSRCVRYQ